MNTINLTEQILGYMNNGSQLYTLLNNDISPDAEFYTKNSDLGDDFIAYTDSFINQLTTWKENIQLWNEYIDYIPLYSKLNTNDALKGLEFMDKMAETPLTDVDLTMNFFSDDHAYSIQIFQTFMVVLMANLKFDKDELLAKYPNLIKDYDFFLSDLMIGFIELMPKILIQEHFKEFSKLELE